MNPRLLALTQKAERLRGHRDVLLQEQAAVEAEVTGLAAKEQTLVKVVALLHSLLDTLLQSKASDLAGILTEGCRAIFFDQNLSVEAEIAIRRGRVNIDLYTVETKADGRVIRGPVLETFGGGVASVQGIILRLYSVVRLGLRRFVAADEPLAAVSTQYVAPVGAFLRQFCEATGMDLLMVTHEPAFLEHAHVAYEAQAPHDKTEIELLQKDAE